MDPPNTERAFVAGIPRLDALNVLREVSNIYQGKMIIPGTVEELRSLDANPHTRNMAVDVSVADVEMESYAEHVIQREDTSIRVRVQRLPFDYKEAVEVFAITAPARPFMNAFIADATALLVEGTDISEKSVFLKAWTLVQERPGRKASFIPILRVMVRSQDHAAFLAKWRGAADGKWVKTPKGFQTQVWRSMKKLKESRPEGKRPATQKVVFVNGMQEGWTVEQLEREWQQAGVSKGAFDVVKIAEGRSGMIVLSPDDVVCDRDLRVAEMVMEGLARPGMKMRLNLNAAPDHVREQEAEKNARQTAQGGQRRQTETTRAWGTTPDKRDASIEALVQCVEQLTRQVRALTEQVVDLSTRQTLVEEKQGAPAAWTTIAERMQRVEELIRRGFGQAREDRPPREQAIESPMDREPWSAVKRGRGSTPVEQAAAAAKETGKEAVRPRTLRYTELQEESVEEDY